MEKRLLSLELGDPFLNIDAILPLDSSDTIDPLAVEEEMSGT